MIKISLEEVLKMENNDDVQNNVTVFEVLLTM